MHGLNVILADDSPVVADQMGDVIISFEKAKLRLTEVLLFPHLRNDLILLSVGKLANKGIYFLFHRTDFRLSVQDNGFVLGHGERDIINGPYSLQNPTCHEIPSALFHRISTSSSKAPTTCAHELQRSI